MFFGSGLFGIAGFSFGVVGGGPFFRFSIFPVGCFGFAPLQRIESRFTTTCLLVCDTLVGRFGFTLTQDKICGGDALTVRMSGSRCPGYLEKMVQSRQWGFADMVAPEVFVHRLRNRVS